MVLSGIYRGTVTSTDDPAGQFRIRAKVPQEFGDDDTNWAMPAFPIGLSQVPKVNDRVWVMFEAGDPQYPVYIGSWAKSGIPVLVQGDVTDITFPIPGTDITPGTITGTQIANGSVGAAQIADFSIAVTKYNDSTHHFNPPVLTSNSPSSGFISWSSFTMVYQGVAYTIAAGNTNQPYAYWVYGGTTLTTSATLPALTVNDCLILLNKSGVAFNAQATQAIDGSLIVNGSIGTNQLAANSITATQISAGAINGQTITGAVLIGSTYKTTTTTTVSRVEVDSGGLRGYPTDRSFAGTVGFIPMQGSITSGQSTIAITSVGHLGPEVVALANSHNITGPGLPAGTKITDWGFNNIAVSNNASSTQTAQAYTIDPWELWCGQAGGGGTPGFFTFADIGRFVSGPGIAAGTTIVAVISPYVAKLSQNQTTPGASGTYTLTGPSMNFSTSSGVLNVGGLAGATITSASSIGTQTPQTLITADGIKFYNTKTDRPVTVSFTAGVNRIDGGAPFYFTQYDVGRFMQIAGLPVAVVTSIDSTGRYAFYAQTAGSSSGTNVAGYLTNGTYLALQIGTTNSGALGSALGYDSRGALVLHADDPQQAIPAVVSNSIGIQTTEDDPAHDASDRYILQIVGGAFKQAAFAWNNAELALYSASRDGITSQDPSAVFGLSGATGALNFPREVLGSGAPHGTNNLEMTGMQTFTVSSTTFSAFFGGISTFQDYTGMLISDSRSASDRIVVRSASDDGLVYNSAGSGYVTGRFAGVYALHAFLQPATSGSFGNTTGSRVARWVTAGASVLGINDGIPANPGQNVFSCDISNLNLPANFTVKLQVWANPTTITSVDWSGGGPARFGICQVSG